MDLITDHGAIQATVIGDLLLEDKALGKALAQLTAADFTYDQYRELFLAICRLYAEDKDLDPTAVLAEVKERPAPSNGWYNLIRDCMIITGTSAYVDEHIRILREDARLLRIREFSPRLEAVKNLDDAQGIVQAMTAELVDSRRSTAVGMEEALSQWFERMKTKPEYLPWGIRQMSEKLYIEQGDFVIIGGYPSTGKTALALNMAWTMAEKRTVCFYSLETNPNKLQDRLISMVAAIPMATMKNRKLTSENFDTVASLSQTILSRRLKYQPAAGWTAQDIINDAKAHRYDVIIIDYIQLISIGKARDRVQGLTEASITIHTGAQSTGITVIGLSQLTRPLKNGGKRGAPRMSDLRETGQWEQDADAIMLLYLEDDNAPNSRRICNVEKNKEGELGRIYLHFDGATQTFSPNRNQTAPKAKKKEPEYKQQTFKDLAGENPDLPFEEENK